MKEKTKKIIFGYLPGFITGLVICGSISVIAATYFPSNNITYDNKESGLSSTNVQGAIDELYGVCFPSAGNQIIEDNNLEKDPYEDRYFFKGANPNNYISFNEENDGKASWRILSIEKDGTIKIVRNESFLANVWSDNSQENAWEKPTFLNTFFNNGNYYNSLSTTAKNQIAEHNFSIGSITLSNNDLSNQIDDENSKIWNGKIALPTVSEYIRTNSNTSQCGTFKLNNDNSSICNNTNWMKVVTSRSWWTLSAVSDTNNMVTMIFSTGGISSMNSMTSHYLRPTLYLSSDIKITGRIGTQSDPYQISL